MEDVDKISVDRVSAFSVSEIEKFFTSPMWLCIEADLKDWLERVRNMMDLAPLHDMFSTDADTGTHALDVAGINRLQGEAVRLKQFILLPVLYKRDRMLLEEDTEDEDKEAGGG